MKIILVAGARPNFPKIAPILKELENKTDIETILVHTGQHYDSNMSDVFFKELGIREPDINLGIRGNQAEQTAQIIEKFDKLVEEQKPDLAIVVGDVTSTLACAIVCAKRKIKLAHIEAGLRSFNYEMPEEINRIVTDVLSNYLFVTEESGIQNLIRQGIPSNKISFVGHVMIDTLIQNIEKAKNLQTWRELNLTNQGYAIMTLHRPQNVDDSENLQKAVDITIEISKKIQLVWPIHPRTKANLEKFNMLKQLEEANIKIIEPQGYLEFLNLVMHAKFIVTDSGGVQEETTYLRLPCLTLRDETERPITVDVGTNTVTGLNKRLILAKVTEILTGTYKKGAMPPLWDGFASKRIVDTLLKKNENAN
ncbi:MAG: UDP-N-acetylglucosamine 2-epimerase (non-hydrolyzing) [DPANN group archaeon]|nr:UDP-N-acetylglucosamine 2-epimerase (non-hydrolyzing) [DPANN group archaeon]